MIGRRLSHYRILEKIGQGGMGEVYLAEDPNLRRKVALKVLPAEMAADEDRRARFKREAQAVAALNHPNIVTIHSVEEADGVHFMTMEMVEGETLSRRIRKEGLSPTEVFDVAIPVADALAAAHARGIVHRDVKPENVMLTPEGRVKVLDFGLARMTETTPGARDDTGLPTASVTQEGKILGTVAYMSPEQAEGRPVDARSDVFSLGVVLYEMSTGRKPFQGETVISTITSIMRDTPASISEIRPGLPRHLGRIVARCLMKDPERRYQSAKDLRNELEILKEECATAGMTRAAGEAPPERGRQARRRGRWQWPVAGAAVLALAAVATVYLLRAGRGVEPADGASAPADAAAGARSDASIAVLPFTSVGTDEESLVFASGIHNDLLTQLSKIGALKVISRTSVMEYQNTSKNLRHIAEELGVATVMEGSVQRAGSRLRINAKLVDARNDRPLWAETYDRELTARDIFDIQGDIARQIAGALQARLTPEQQHLLEARPTENLEAYELYLKGMEFAARGEDQSNAFAALDMLGKAVVLDPDFALAQAQIGRLQTQVYWMHYDRSPDRLVRARQAIDEAFRIAPGITEAHMALGYYYYWGFLEYDRALEEFAKASAIQPNNTLVVGGIGWVKRRQGKMDEALDYFRKATDLDPLNISYLQGIADTLRMLRRYDESETWYRRTIDLNPLSTNLHMGIALLHLQRDGDTAGARALLDRAAALGLQEPNLTLTAIRIETLDRRYDAALDRIDRIGSDVLVDDQFHFYPVALMRGWVLRLKGDAEGARRSFDAARAILEERIRSSGDDERLHSALGIAWAGLGRREEALRAGRRAVELLPVEKEAMRGVVRREDLAVIHAMIGETREAVDQIEFLLSHSGMTSKALLRADPTWDPIRDDPRFQQLVAE